MPVDPRIVDYIRQNLAKGYNIHTIMDYLVRYGYPRNVVEEAAYFAQPKEVKHVVHFHATTLLAIVLIMAVLGGAIGAIMWFTSKESSTLLDVTIETKQTTAKAGDALSFIYELSNLGSAKRHDVELEHSLIAIKGSKEVASKTETIALETKATHETELKIPDDALPGSYILRTVAKYDGKTAVASLSVKVQKGAAEGPTDDQKETLPNCDDRIKNQDEEGVDCGGVCRKCEAIEPAAGCDDNNQCTTDIEEDSQCRHEQIIPCCPNKVCELGEDSSKCIQDCPKAAVIADPGLEGLSLFDTVEKIKEIAKSDPNRALTLCNKLEESLFKDKCMANIAEVTKTPQACDTIKDERSRDACYANVAKIANVSSTCQKISRDASRDSCYMTFVTQGDYSMCESIFNQYLKQSCYSLRDLEAGN